MKSTAMVCAVAFAAVTNALAQDGRPWAVQDSVAIRYFVEHPTENYVPGWLGDDEEPIVVAPDGKHFFFVSHRGDLSTDGVVYDLDVFSVAQVRAALARSEDRHGGPLTPLRRLTLASGPTDAASGSGASGIFFPRWERASTILFLHTGENRRASLHRFDIDTGTNTRLTEEKYDIAGLTIATGGRSVVFQSAAAPAPRTTFDYPVGPITDDDLRSQVFDFTRATDGGAFLASFNGAPARPVTPSMRAYSFPFRPWVSPDGKWAVAVYVPQGLLIPESWKRYSNHECRVDYRFMLIDIEHGGVRPLFDAPAGEIPGKVVPDRSGCPAYSGYGRPPLFDAFWSSDSRSVVLLNTSLPLTGNRDERRRVSYVASYTLATDSYAPLEPMSNERGDRVGQGSWLEEGRQLLVTRATSSGAPAPGRLYTFDRKGWTLQPAPQRTGESEAKLPFAIELRQSANDPPVMMALDGARSVALTAPDAALAGLRRAPADTVEWQEGSETIKGLLMLPRDDAGGAPLPLVIQGFSYRPNHFRPDGVTLSAFAAQALAAQGFAVLQMDFAYEDQKTFMTPQEAPPRVARVDAAVEMLASKGIVDPARVGLMGFSRSGYSTYYVLTHPGRVKPAAAIIFDSITMGYGDYVNFRAYGGAQIFERQYGGSFWRNKQAWLEASPEFNVEKIMTPVLFSKTGGGSLLTIVPTLSAFTYTRRPFEYLAYPEGQHQLERPRERIASMQATVDWMNFWLKGEERPDAEDQYTRWRKIKADWQETQAQETAAK